jgi:hypothetical protein
LAWKLRILKTNTDLNLFTIIHSNQCWTEALVFLNVFYYSTHSLNLHNKKQKQKFKQNTCFFFFFVKLLIRSNARNLSCVILVFFKKWGGLCYSYVSQKMRWFLKSPLGLWLIIIKFWSNSDFKNHLIFWETQTRVTHDRLQELLIN